MLVPVCAGMCRYICRSARSARVSNCPQQEQEPERTSNMYSKQKVIEIGMSQSTTHVVIIGGGFAGCKIAQLLLAEPSMRVTLIDPKDFFEMVWVNLRAMVIPDWAQRSIIPFSTFIPRAQLVKDEAASLDTKSVTTKSGKTIEFDFCVIAVGSSYAGFLKAAVSTSTSSQRLSEMHAFSEQIKSAGSVLIVGGGPSGVELAFEILDVFPNKKVASLFACAMRASCVIHLFCSLLWSIPAVASSQA